MQPVLDYLANHRPRFEEELFQYLRLPSVSAQSSHNKDMRATADWLVKHSRSIGLKVKKHKTSFHPIVTASTPKCAGKRPHFLVYGHYDVQPAEPLEEWDTPPFEPTIRNGAVYARGATDNKGQHFAHLKAVEAFLQTGTDLGCDLTFVIEGEEGAILPHPRMHQRAFVLLPLGELAPDWVHPVLKTPIEELVSALPKDQEIRAVT